MAGIISEYHHATLHIKSDDQTELYPKNKREDFQIQLNHDYRLNISKKYFITLNHLSYNYDILNAKLIYEKEPIVQTLVMIRIPHYSEVYDSYNPYQITQSEFVRRFSYMPDVHWLRNVSVTQEARYNAMNALTKEDMFNEIKEQFNITNYKWSEIEEVYQLISHRDTFPKDYFNFYRTKCKIHEMDVTLYIVAVNDSSVTISTEESYYCSTALINCKFNAPDIEIDFSDPVKRDNIKVTFENAKKFIEKIKRIAILPANIINLVEDRPSGESDYHYMFKMNKLRHIPYIRMTFPKEIYKLFHLNSTKMIADVGIEMFHKQEYKLPAFDQKKCRLSVKILEHLCVEVNSCEQNTLSNSHRSILCTLPIDYGRITASKLTRYNYVQPIIRNPVCLEITDRHIKHLRFKLTDIDGNTVRFRNPEDKQKQFPTILSITIVEHD